MTWMLASRFEDTIAMARLILSGLTLRYPNIQFLIPHLGGTLPFSCSGWTTWWSARAGAKPRART